jgi:hypothetical protein
LEGLRLGPGGRRGTGRRQTREPARQRPGRSQDESRDESRDQRQLGPESRRVEFAARQARPGQARPADTNAARVERQ